MTSPRATDRPRRAMRDLGDAALIDAMREGSSDAWQEFMMRFRPLLEQFGRRTGMPRVEWSACVLTVLEDAAMRWAIDGAALPRSMAAYLMRAVNFHRMTLERDAKRRAVRYELAARGAHREGVVVSLCSEATIRASGDPWIVEDTEGAGVARFCQLLRDSLSEQEKELLSRLGDGVPHREIAELLGVSYEAARKRIQRLCAKVRDRVPLALEQLNAGDRGDTERLLRRLQPPRHRKGEKDDAV